MFFVAATQVLLRNLSDQLANGSRGKVIGFTESAGNAGGHNGMASTLAIQQYATPLRPQVHFDCGITQTIEVYDFWQGDGSGGSLTRWQLPLKLGESKEHTWIIVELLNTSGVRRLGVDRAPRARHDAKSRRAPDRRGVRTRTSLCRAFTSDKFERALAALASTGK